MQCFCRWDDKSPNISFRDQTILQFGDSWDLLANFVLLNPGSAVPSNNEDKTDYLKSKSLPFFVEPGSNEKYLKFKIDPLMNSLVKLFSQEYTGGVIKIYNLFNLKNQNSVQALEQLTIHDEHKKMFTIDSEVKYCNAPVIIASGSIFENSSRLKDELRKYIELALKQNLYRLAKTGNKQFEIIKAVQESTGLVESYHPSHTFKNDKRLNEFIIP